MLRAAKSSLKSVRAPVARTLRVSMTSRALSTASVVARPMVAAKRPIAPSASIRAPMFQVRNYAAEVVKVPQMAESITEGTLSRFEKEVGDFVEADEEVATIETDKIDVTVNAPFAGTLTEFLANPDDTVEVGQPLFKIEPGEGGQKAADKPKKEESAPEPKKEEPAAAPKQESAPEPKQEAPKPAAPKADKPAAPKQEAAAPAPSTPGSREERRVKMNRMRMRISERLKESQNTAASLTTFQEVDMSSLMDMRKQYKDEILKNTGVKFGFMGAFSKAACLAMKDIPAVNAVIEGPNGGDTIVYRDYVDISIAVATPKGLVTPVVRNAESLGVVGIEREISSLGAKARDGKLTLEDMAGGTFTISNGGVFGSLMGTPIINMPQTAVLGLHGVKERAVVVNGQVVARPMMYLALTYDHRLLDGREATTFLRVVKELVEDPRKMLLME
uniref:dihydrolipoyllysine-residue succinyltransferase n=1 Tax=Blastobotrys adeninivorans TaxID=409370 RepID=A0A060T8J2_BLAAD